MGYKHDYEYWRDFGHTWGPGIDDRNELSEAEKAENKKTYEEHLQKIKEYSVTPRKEFLDAGIKLERSLPSNYDLSVGNAPFNWREEHNKNAIELCKKASESLGYSFVLADFPFEKEGHFAIGVDYYGYLPDRGGNIHKFVAYDIKNIEDCLQLVADFEAIGKTSTTYFDNRFYFFTGDTGELHYELEKWCMFRNTPLPHKDTSKKAYFKQLIKSTESKTTSKNSNEKKHRSNLKKDKSKGDR